MDHGDGQLIGSEVKPFHQREGPSGEKTPGRRRKNPRRPEAALHERLFENPDWMVGYFTCFATSLVISNMLT
jgi:hypothetical protein